MSPPTISVIDPVSDAAAGIGEAAAGSLLQAVSTWILEGVVWTARAVFSFFDQATSPNLASAWFSGAGGPYAMVLQLAGMLLVGFALVAVTQGVLAGDVGGVIRVAALRLPVGVLSMVATIGVAQAAIAATDAVAAGFLHRFADDGEAMALALHQAMPADGLTPPIAVVFVGFVAVAAGLVVVAELVVRSALIYVVVALSPLVFAAQVWPTLAGAARRVLELLAALILSKLAIAVALAVAGAAVTSAIPNPTAATTATDAAGGSATTAIGVLLAAAAAFGVAAFSPVLIHRLIPLTEAAAVAQGTSGGPLRAGRSVLATTNGAAAASHRLGLLAAGATATSAVVAASAGASGTGGGGGEAPGRRPSSAVRLVDRSAATAGPPTGGESPAPRSPRGTI
jgi:hypothetical protein